jgi:MFS transporter, FSR family, fosmidomycin resistance protein
VAVLLTIELVDELVPRSAALPGIRHELGLSYAQVGLILSVPVLVGVALEPAIGLLGDTRHRRTLIVAGGLALAAALVGIAGAPGFAGVLAGFAIAYPASGAFVSLSQAALMDLDPPARDRNMSRWVVAGGVGAVAGPLLVSGASALGLGWRPPFLVVAAAAAALVLGVRRVPSPAADHRLGEGVRRALGALRRPDVVRWLALLEAADLLLDVMRGFLAVYLVDAAGAGTVTAAAALAVVGLADVAASAALLPLLARFSPLAIVRTGALAALALYPAALVVPSVPLKLALFAAVTAATAGWYPLLQARLYEALPEASGTAMALGSVSGTAAAAVPLVVGLVAERYGVAAAMWSLVAGPALLVLGLRRGREARGSAAR